MPIKMIYNKKRYLTRNPKLRAEPKTNVPVTNTTYNGIDIGIKTVR